MLKTARACFQIFTQNPVFLNANKRAYNSTLTNLCNALIHNQDFAATQNQLFHLKALIENSTETFKSEMRANAITTLLNLEIIVVQNMDNKQSIASLQQEVENVVEQYGKFLSAAQLSDIYFNIANALFSIKDYNKAMEYVNRILQHSKDEVDKDVYMTTRLLFLLLHFELGSQSLLDSSIETTRKYLSRHNKLHKIEKLIFSFLKVPKLNTILEIKSQINASRKLKLDSLLLSLNIHHWLEEKIAQLTKKTF
jgi:tetratricopeptide (TPR) repeat protein